MKLKTIRLTNFQSWKSIELSIDDTITYLIVGENGSGKTSLFIDSLLFCLFGMFRYISIDNVVMGGEDSCEVSIDFVIDFREKADYIWTVKRIREKGKGTKLYIFTTDTTGEIKDCSMKTVADTEKKILDMLGIDDTIFLNSVVFKQQEVNGFCSGTDKERKDFLTSILSLEIFDRALELVRKELNDTEKTIDNLQSKIEELTRDENRENIELQITDNNVIYEQVLKGVLHIEEQEAVIKEDIINVRLQLEKFNTVFENSELNITELQDLEKKLALYNIELEILRTEFTIKVEAFELNGTSMWHTQLEVKKQESDIKIAELQALNTEKGSLLQQCTELKEKLEVLKKDDSKCYVCENPLSVDKWNEIVNKYTIDLEKNKESQNVCIENINTVIKIRTIINIEVLKLEEKVQYTKDLGKEVEQLSIDGNKKKQSIKEVLLDIAKKKERLLSNEELTIEKEKQSIMESQQNSLNERLLLLQIDHRTKRDEYLTIVKNIESLETQLRYIQANLERKVKIEQELITVQEQQKDLLILEKAFSSSGIKALVFENSIQYLEDAINRYLGQLFENIKMQFVFQIAKKSGKKGEMKEKFELLFFDGESDRLFSSFSGGEKRRIEFSIFMGIQALLNSRIHNFPNFIVFDELFDSLDVEGIDKICRFLSEQRVGQYFIISHNDIIKDRFDKCLQILKKKAHSTALAVG